MARARAGDLCEIRAVARIEGLRPFQIWVGPAHVVAVSEDWVQIRHSIGGPPREDRLRHDQVRGGFDDGTR